MKIIMEDVFGITGEQIWLSAATLLLTAVSMIFVLMRTRPYINGYKKSMKEGYAGEATAGLRASVVIFASGDSANLNDILPEILEQDYSGKYEVIVVNDGEDHEARCIVESMMLRYPNLYFTSAPDGARSLSRKKLALTLGVKAAKGDVIVHTTVSARIPSNQWLGRIMRHFEENEAIEVVLGNVRIVDRKGGLGGIIRSFDESVDNAGWVTPALKGRPWRGTEHNLAYRREVFFRNKGFSSHLNLRAGDDDIFISEIARGDNTAVELSPEATVSVEVYNGRRAFMDNMLRRRFTIKFIKNRPRIVGTMSTLCYFASPVPVIVAMSTGGFERALGWIAAGVILLLWYATGLLWNPLLRCLSARKATLLTPFIAFGRPLRIVLRTIKGVFVKQKKYTWE